jgi:hypothetical protein
MTPKGMPGSGIEVPDGATEEQIRAIAQGPPYHEKVLDIQDDVIVIPDEMSDHEWERIGEEGDELGSALAVASVASAAQQRALHEMSDDTLQLIIEVETGEVAELAQVELDRRHGEQ